MKIALLVLSAASFVSAADLTIYNQDFAVVRDTVPLTLKDGVNEVRFAGVTAQLEADSVILRDPAGKIALQILEQSYRNDPVSEKMLLAQFEGKTLQFFRKESTKPDQFIAGKVIRSGYVPGGEAVEPIIEVKGELMFELPGRPFFPALQGDNVLKPTLAWKIQSPGEAKFDAELAYLSEGFRWEASYNVVQPEEGETVDLTGWVTMTNSSGTTFSDAKVKLMAGDVRRQPRIAAAAAAMQDVRAPSTLGGPPPVSEKTFDEYHLYTLAHAVTLRDKETKQVEFVRASGVKAGREYVYNGSLLWPTSSIPGLPGLPVDPGADPEVETTTKVEVYRTIENREANQLGMPLPKGRIRFYTKEGQDGGLQFVGENVIDHTPKNEQLRIRVGNSFDLVGRRKRLDSWRDEANDVATESIEITLRNHKKVAAEIIVAEGLYGRGAWEIVEKSQPFEKKSAQRIEFRVPLNANEEKKVTYKVKYKW